MSENAAAEAAPKKSKKMLIIIVLAVVLLGGGGGAAFFLLGSGTAEAEEVKPEPGPVVAMEQAVTVNLADGHYLRLAMALQPTVDATEVEMAKAIDLAIAHYGAKKIGELATPAGKQKAKVELLEKVEKAYEEQVYDIYFTEFVTQ